MVPYQNLDRLVELLKSIYLPGNTAKGLVANWFQKVILYWQSFPQRLLVTRTNASNFEFSPRQCKRFMIWIPVLIRMKEVFVFIFALFYLGLYPCKKTEALGIVGSFLVLSWTTYIWLSWWTLDGTWKKSESINVYVPCSVICTVHMTQTDSTKFLWPTKKSSFDSFSPIKNLLNYSSSVITHKLILQNFLLQSQSIIFTANLFNSPLPYIKL